MRAVVLIGFMGAGKTTIGKALSKKNRIAFVDTDQKIVEKAGMTIPEIFAAQGEEAFRQIESQVLKDLLLLSGRAVISTGGGLPLREENRRLLQRMGSVVYLKISPETVLNRLKGDNTRPLLQGPGGRERVGELLEAREPFYREAADFILKADGKTVEQIVEEAEERLGEQL